MTERIETVSPGTWNGLLVRSSQATPFHLTEVLERCADALGARLRRYVGYKGQEPTGLFPVLELRRGPFVAALSTAPGLVPYGGPVLLAPDGLKRRKRERWNRSFVEGVLERVEDDVDPDYCQVWTGPAYADERPFVWNGYDATVRHTYVVGLPEGEKQLAERLDTEGQSHPRRDRPTVKETTAAAPGEVLGLVVDRDAEQCVGPGPEPAFLRALYRALPDGCMRVYACRDGDRLLGGDVTIELGDTVYGWLGASDAPTDVPVDDLLYERVLGDACRRGYSEYDMLGTDEPRRFRYRSELGAELRSYVGLVRGGPVGRLGARLSGLAP